MKKLLPVFALLVMVFSGLNAQQVTFVSPNQESDLPYRDTMNLSYAGRIKVAVPGGNFTVDTAGTRATTPKVRFLIPDPISIGAQSGLWWGAFTYNSAPPYKTYRSYVWGSRSGLIRKVRVTHPDTLVLEYGSWWWDTWGLWVYGNQVPFTGFFDLEIQHQGRSIYKDSAFNFNGVKERTQFRHLNRNADKITLRGLEGLAGQTLDVDITGQNTTFTQASPVFLSAGICPNELIVNFRNDTNFSTFQGMAVLSPTRMVASITIPANTPPGYYDVALMTTRDGVKHINNGFRVLSGAMAEGGHIKGRVNWDKNGNCRQDSGDAGISGMVVEAMPGNHLAITDSSGRYDVSVPIGTYTLRRRSRFGWTPICPSGASDSVRVTAAIPIRDSVDFTDSLRAYYDLSVSAISGFARPGFKLPYWADVINLSNLQANAVLRFVPDTLLDSVRAVSPAADLVRGDTVFWNIALDSYRGRRFYVETKVPADVALLGRETHSQFELITTVPDTNTANNHAVVTNLIRGSYDPNDKAVEPAGSLTEADSVLTYTIRFQNTGTDTAFTVVVRDTLHENLDVASINTLIASHRYRFTLKGTRNAEWRFDYLLLVDSNRNEEASHGFIKFSLNRKKGLPVGSPISNKAFIYFDFNPPIETNLVQNTIVSVRQPLGKKTTVRNCQVIPNPMHGPGKVVLMGEAALGQAIMTVTDALGRTILTKTNIKGKEFTFGDRFTPGVYFLLITEQGRRLAEGRFAVE